MGWVSPFKWHKTYINQWNIKRFIETLFTEHAEISPFTPLSPLPLSTLMIIFMVESEDEEALELFHDEVGHSVFLSLALSLNKKDQVDKVHRYFGHRSGRRIWELFSKAKRMMGKRKQVLEMIEKCKVCSQHNKAPPRPKVGYQLLMISMK